VAQVELSVWLASLGQSEGPRWTVTSLGRKFCLSQQAGRLCIASRLGIDVVVSMAKGQTSREEAMTSHDDARVSLFAMITLSYELSVFTSHHLSQHKGQLLRQTQIIFQSLGHCEKLPCARVIMV